MFNSLLHFGKKKVKVQLPKEKYPYYSIYLRKESYEVLKRIHNWKSYADFGRAIQKTRQMARLIARQEAGCSANMVGTIAELLGLKKSGSCWCRFFTIIKEGEYPSRHQKFNELKYRGEFPYEKYSTSAEFRKSGGWEGETR